MTVNLINAYRYMSLLFIFARFCEISAQFSVNYFLSL